MEHLERPGDFLRAAKSHLQPGGRAVLAIPAILTEQHRRLNEAIPFHRSNLTVDEWLRLFGDHGFEVELYRHTYAGPAELDFSSPWRSNARLEDFDFALSTRDEVYAQGTLTGLYLLTPRA